jgi:hypothetical protein
MKKPTVYSIVFFLAFFALAASAKDMGAPVAIAPVIQDYSKLFSQKLLKKFAIGDIVDKRINFVADSVGETRAGRFTMSALMCKPAPGAILQQSLAGMLRELGVLAEDKKDAEFQIDAELLDYSLEETNKVFSQQIKATIKFRVFIHIAATGALVNQFVIRAEDSRSALDATPFAARVATNAMISALQNLLESLAPL